jgi:hypothetical protein
LAKFVATIWAAAGGIFGALACALSVFALIFTTVIYFHSEPVDNFGNSINDIGDVANFHNIMDFQFSDFHIM